MGRTFAFLLIAGLAFGQAGLHPGNQAYDTKGLAFKGRIQELQFWDLDQDGLWEAIVTHQGNIGETPLRHLSLWFQRPDIGFPFHPDQTITLPRDAAALSIGDYAAEKGAEILYFTGDGVWYLPLDGRKLSLTPRRLLILPTFFDFAQDDSATWWSFAQDVDGDGHADLVVPTPDAYKLFFQTEPGVFGRVLTFRPRAVRKADRDVAGPLKGYLTFKKSLPRMLVKDFDGANGADLICQVEGQFQFFLQDLEHDFPPQPNGEFPLSFWKLERKKNSVETSTMLFEDLEGNGSLDMVVSYTEGEIGLFESISTRILVYMGQFGEPYLPKPQQQIHIRGISIAPMLSDVNGDGKLDLIVSSFRTDLMQGLRKALLDNFTITYYVYHFDSKAGKFSETPDIDQDVVVDSKMVEKGKGTPLARFDGDFDGDGRKDMLLAREVGDDQCELLVRRGQKAVGILGQPFEKNEYIKRRIEPPRGIVLAELNGDGRTDYILQYTSRIEVNTSKKR